MWNTQVVSIKTTDSIIHGEFVYDGDKGIKEIQSGCDCTTSQFDNHSVTYKIDLVPVQSTVPNLLYEKGKHGYDKIVNINVIHEDNTISVLTVNIHKYDEVSD